ncbi:hypothetical protein GH714_041540 [Hevea brasiliensis]|uniref:Uncharacterized protein n=1 Tax=Hevea brasiliensis TaxID=3981 RepID=A0A6A6MW60_HEVBR|nr:hypothetical protein GH714_041540 [Hevea brasiliensis]
MDDKIGDESLVHEMETDDEENIIVMNNRKAFRASPVGNGYGDDDMLVHNHLKSNTDENDLGKLVKKKSIRYVIYDLGCDHTTFDFVIVMIIEIEKKFKEFVQN